MGEEREEEGKEKRGDAGEIKRRKVRGEKRGRREKEQGKEEG